MEIFLKRVFRFLIFLPVIWIAFITIWGSVIAEKYRKNLVYSRSVGFMDVRLKEADSVSNVELLIVGSSHVYRGIDPRKFEQQGIKTFNLGSSLQSPMQTEYLLKKYLDQFNPKLVLFEVGYKTFSSDGIEGALDVILNNPELDLGIFKMALDVNNIVVYNTLAYTFFRKNVLNESRQEFLAENETDTYIRGGFVTRKDSTYTGPYAFGKIVKPLNAEQQQSFENCLEMLKQRGVKIIMIETPVLHDYYSSIENMHDYKNYFDKISAMHGYYNFNNDKYGTKYFYDHHHLNSTGVEEFNEELMEVLRPHLKVLSQDLNSDSSEKSMVMVADDIIDP